MDFARGDPGRAADGIRHIGTARKPDAAEIEDFEVGQP